jgi:hypothetical protein
LVRAATVRNLEKLPTDRVTLSTLISSSRYKPTY